MRPDRQNGHDRAVRHLHRPGTRGLYVSACGTGKTLVGIRLAGTPGSQLTLVVVPTLDLIAQTALAWRKDGLAAALSAVAPGVLDAVTEFCTYDSLDKIEAAQRTGRSVPPFDLAGGVRGRTPPAPPPNRRAGSGCVGESHGLRAGLRQEDLRVSARPGPPARHFDRRSGPPGQGPLAHRTRLPRAQARSGP
ncbi:DEAD/DEAH box helicase family protein [Streptomyces avermitilis]|uniref:DEAD/DEAH box helicase family protein n=1 Tax=Streptomyces avermitilis TaxID=33903 RepID=UPI0033C765E9